MSHFRKYIKYDGGLFKFFSFLSPDAWSILNLLSAALAAWFYFNGQFWAGAILFGLSGLLDVVDGGVARYIKKSSKFGSMFDAVMDRIGEGLVYVGLSKHYPIAALALMTSFIVSYIRARDDRLVIGIAERGDRMVLIVGASLLNVIEPGLWLITVLSIITIIMRLRAAKKLE